MPEDAAGTVQAMWARIRRIQVDGGPSVQTLVNEAVIQTGASFDARSVLAGVEWKVRVYAQARGRCFACGDGMDWGTSPASIRRFVTVNTGGADVMMHPSCRPSQTRPGYHMTWAQEAQEDAMDARTVAGWLESQVRAWKAARRVTGGVA